MQKGIVMEVRPRYWVVMTPDGEFVRVPSSGKQVQPGEEITFTLERRPRISLEALRRPWTMGGLAAAVALFLFLLPIWWAPSDVHAETYVYIDLNTSLEVGLDKEGYVVEVKALNSTAKRLVRDIDHEGVTVDEFVLELLRKAKQVGYLHPEERVLVSQVNPTGSSKKMLQSIEARVKKDPHLKRDELNIYTLPLPDLVEEKARKAGVSPAKYAVWLLVQRDGKDIPQERLPELSITELLTLVNIEPILQDPPSKKQWVAWINEVEGNQKWKTNPDEDSDAPKEEKPDSPAPPDEGSGTSGETGETSGGSGDRTGDTAPPTDSGGDPSTGDTPPPPDQPPNDDPPPSQNEGGSSNSSSTTGGSSSGSALEEGGPTPTEVDASSY